MIVITRSFWSRSCHTIAGSRFPCKQYAGHRYLKPTPVTCQVNGDTHPPCALRHCLYPSLSSDPEQTREDMTDHRDQMQRHPWRRAANLPIRAYIQALVLLGKTTTATTQANDAVSPEFPQTETPILKSYIPSRPPYLSTPPSSQLYRFLAS